MKLKVITIDFWNTLFDSSNGTRRNALRQHVLLEEIGRHGSSITEEQYTVALQASWDFFNKIWFSEQRTPLPNETIGFFWDYLKMPPDPGAVERIAEIFSTSILDSPPKVNPGARDVLKALKNNYKIGLVSDTGFSPGVILRELLNREQLLEYFDAFSFSDETAVSKPQAKAFSTILDKFGCPPELALHIGDIEKTDIDGAIGIGMKSIRYNGDQTTMKGINNPKKSKANAEISHWNEFPDALKKVEENF